MFGDSAIEIDSAMEMEIDSDIEMEIELSDGCRFGSSMNMAEESAVAEESAMEIELPSWFLSFFIGKDPNCGLLPTMKDVAPEDSWVINEILSRLPADLAPNDLGLINQILSRLPEDSWLIKGIQSRLPAELIPHGVPVEDSSSSEDSYVTNGSLFSLPEEYSSLPPEDTWVVKEILPSLPDEDSELVKEILPSLPDEDSELVKLSVRVKENLSIPSGEDLPLFVHLTSEHLEVMDDILSVVSAGLVSQVSSVFRNILSCGYISDVKCVEQTIAPLHGRLGNEVRWLLNEIQDHLQQNMFTSKSSYILPPLPDNVAIMILSRLPTKSLAKYLCVSNHMMMAICNVGIPKPMSGLLIHRTPCVLSQEIYLPFSCQQSEEPKWKKYMLKACDMYGLKVLDSCTRFLLLTSCRYITTEYFICDVSNSKFVHIDANKPDYWRSWSCDDWNFPIIYPEFEVPCDQLCFFAFDPYECEAVYCKVVRFSQEDDCICVQIYNSQWLKWTKIIFCEVAPLDIGNWVPKSAYYKGALYIITRDEKLVRFDIVNEMLSFNELPDKHVCSREECLQVRSWKRLAACMGVSRGHLYHAVYSCLQEELRIYLLDNEVDLTWRLVHNIAREQLFTSGYHSVFQPIAFHPTSELVYLGTERWIFTYDPNTGICKIHGQDCSQEVYWTEVYPFMFYLGER